LIWLYVSGCGRNEMSRLYSFRLARMGSLTFTSTIRLVQLSVSLLFFSFFESQFSVQSLFEI
jgi:hypothetical protein